MTNQNSRFITYPSTVDKVRETAIVIDIKPADFIVLTDFLKTTSKDYDIYLYDGESHDLEWLNYVTQDCDHVLIDDTSQVRITPDSTNVRYGAGLEYQTPYGYFAKLIDTVDAVSV